MSLRLAGATAAATRDHVDAAGFRQTHPTVDGLFTFGGSASFLIPQS